MRRLLLFVSLALLLVPAQALAKQRVVGHYRVDFTERIDNSGLIHGDNGDPSFPATADGSAHFTATASWFALVTLRAGQPGIHPLASVDVTNRNVHGVEPATNLTLGAPGADAHLTGQWSGTFSDGETADSATRRPYSCSDDFAGPALAKYLRVSYGFLGGHSSHGFDGRRGSIPASLSLQNTTGGQFQDETLRSSCQATDGSGTPDHIDGSVGFSPLSAMLAAHPAQRGATFRVADLLRHPGKPVTLETKATQDGSRAAPFGAYQGTTDAVVTATMRRAR